MRTATIRLELTESQKAQIRAATGREVSVLELRLHDLPEAAASPTSHTPTEAPGPMHPDRGSPAP